MSSPQEMQESKPVCSLCKGYCLDYKGNMGNCQGKEKKENKCPPGKKPIR